MFQKWMFNLGLTYRQLFVFLYVYNCIKDNNWSPKAISSIVLSDLMGVDQGNVSRDLNKLCEAGLLERSGKSENNCCMYILTPKVFEISKETPITPTAVEEKDYTEELNKIFLAFHFVFNIDVYPIELIGKYAIPLLSEGYAVEDLCAVVKYKGAGWIDSDKMREFIRPQTLFKRERFDEYLSEARMNAEYSKTNDINIDYIHDVYSHLELNESDNLKEWCIKTLRENADMDVKALGIAIHSIYLDLMRNNKKDWVIKLMSNTKTLSDKLPQYKESGIKLSKDGIFDDVSRMRKEPVN